MSRVITLALTMALAAPAHAESWRPSAASASSLPELPFERYQLDNGLTVILHHDPKLPLVAVSVWYDVGGRHEKPGRSGFAHLFEHMMFQGSRHVGEDLHFAYLQKAGGTGTNGTTSFDRTNYFETVPANQLELALWLESDRMGFLLPAITEKSLQNQIDVVKNERRQSIENRPYGLLEEKITQTLYPESHPYYGNVIGSMDDLTAATVDDVKAFFRTYYTPANATLTVAGAFDPKTIKPTIAKYFATIEGQPKPPPVEVPAPVIEAPIKLDYAEPVAKLPKLSIVWMGPSTYQEDTAELDLLAHVISGTKSARLDQRVSYDDQIAQSVTAYFAERKSGSSFRIDLVVRPGRTLEDAHAAVDEVLDDLRQRPPSEAELNRARNSFETMMVRGLEKLGGFSGRAELLQRYNLFLGDPGRVAWDLQRYHGATTESVTRAMSKWLTDKRLVVYATPAAAPAGGGQ